jgi:uncharacterized protein (DUF3084 family)
MICSTGLISQISYPKYDTDSLGQRVVVMTLKQAQVLDSRSELLSLFQKLSIKTQSYDSLCEKTIHLKDVVILKQKMEIVILSKSLTNKDNQINLLQKEIKLNNDNINILNQQIGLKDNIILEKDRQIRNLKLKSFGIGGVCLLVGTLFGIISNR